MILDTLTARQQVALMFPCARSIETMDDRFQESIWFMRGETYFSTILTVNK